MFEVAGSGIEIYCDYSSRALLVAINAPILPGFKSQRDVVATFANFEEWEKSPYYNQVTNEDAIDSITWFWIDLDNSPPSPKALSS